MSAEGVVVWLTGPPAAGKTSIARELVAQLQARGVATAWLDSDVLRKVLTPVPTYSDRERDTFYRTLGVMAAQHAAEGLVSVVSATAHRREWRELARQAAPRFLEVWVRCDEAERRARDPKGLYAKLDAGTLAGLPGADADYEAPEAAEVEIDTTQEPLESAVARIVAQL